MQPVNRRFFTLEEIAAELNVSVAMASSPVVTFNIQDKFFIGHGCESLLPKNELTKKNISICTEII